MTRRTVVPLAAALTLAAAMSACGSTRPATTPDAGTKPSAQAAAQRPEGWEYISPARRARFTADLTGIDPWLTVNPSRHLRRAVTICYDAYHGTPAKKLLYSTAYRYDGGQASVPQGSAKARWILAAVRRWICPSPDLKAHHKRLHLMHRPAGG